MDALRLQIGFCPRWPREDATSFSWNYRCIPSVCGTRMFSSAVVLPSERWSCILDTLHSYFECPFGYVVKTAFIVQKCLSQALLRRQTSPTNCWLAGYFSSQMLYCSSRSTSPGSWSLVKKHAFAHFINRGTWLNNTWYWQDAQKQN